MCGAKSYEQGEETAKYILEHIYNTQGELDYMNECTERKNITFEWIKKNIRGNKIFRPIYIYRYYTYAKDDRRYIKEKKKKKNNTDTSERLIEVRISFFDGKNEIHERKNMKKEELLALEETENIEMSKIDKTIRLMECILVENLDDNEIVIPENTPTNIDKRIVNFLCNQLSDYKYYSEVIQELEWIKEQTSLYEKKPEIVKIQKAMVNYNYNLNYNIDRGMLTKMIHGMNGFRAIYDNLIGHNVTISIPYEFDDEQICRKAKTKLIKFIVYHSGKVTQSGPNEELNKEAYIKFVNTLDLIREDIIRIKPRYITM